MTSNARRPCPGPREADRAAEIEQLRGLTLEERAHLIAVVCRAAAEIERSRRQSGLPPSVSVPWPASTWEILKKQAHHE
jgi:hypothetical protein